MLVKAFSDNPHRFDSGADLMVGADPRRSRPMQVELCRQSRGRLLVRFEGVEGIEQAEPLRGDLIFVPAGALGELGIDEFWEHQLVGLTVVHRDGTVLGEIAGVVGRAGQDLWTVRTAAGEVMFPAARQLVVSVDLEAGRAVIDPPEGLFN